MLCMLCLIVLWGFPLVTSFSGTIVVCVQKMGSSAPSRKAVKTRLDFLRSKPEKGAGTSKHIRTTWSPATRERYWDIVQGLGGLRHRDCTIKRVFEVTACLQLLAHNCLPTTACLQLLAYNWRTTAEQWRVVVVTSVSPAKSR